MAKANKPFVKAAGGGDGVGTIGGGDGGGGRGGDGEVETVTKQRVQTFPEPEQSV